MTTETNSRGRFLQNPPWISALFSNTEFAWLWLIVRVYIGWQWLDSGWGKLGNDAWMGGGSAVQGFWTRAVAIPESGRPPISYDWYRGFLQFMLDNEMYTWFAKMLATGEFLVGLGLLFGALTGIAAFFGAFMNWNFMLSGTASTNPILGILAVFLVIAWKTAGWWGLDRWLLPMLGAPWQKGRLFGGEAEVDGRGSNWSPYMVQQWVTVLLAVGVALYALAELNGWLQVVVLIVAGIVVALAGMGRLRMVSRA